jgi:hypothetical protein
MPQSVLAEIKQVRSFLDTSLRAHLESKGKLCTCCELPSDLCRCVTRANHIREVFEPLLLRKDS